jgi:predicted  nucleic acid-binding Zn-ribbon protein
LVLDAVSSFVSIETPDHAHDPAQRDAQRDDDAGESNRRPDADDELTVVVCPQRVYERLQPELDESRERLCREYEREYEDLLAERAQLEDEIACLERQLDRKESQLDAVVTRNERILEARTESYRRRIEDQDTQRDDGFRWTGRRQTPDLLGRLKR